MVAAPTDPAVRAERTIDAPGMVVMPGGVDMHCHIAGPKVNMARKMMPDQRRNSPPLVRTPLTSLGHGRRCSQHLRDRLSVRGAGLHDGVRRGHPASRRAARPRRIARHAPHRQGLFRPDGQQPLRDGVDPGGEPARLEGLRRLAARCGQGLRRQARQSGRRRDLEANGPQRHRHRRHGRAFRRHAAADHSRRRPSGDAARFAAPGAHSLQQPRHAGQLDDDARDDEGPRRPTRASDARSISQLRRRAGRDAVVLLRKFRDWPSTSTRTPI